MIEWLQNQRPDQFDSKTVMAASGTMVAVVVTIIIIVCLYVNRKDPIIQAMQMQMLSSMADRSFSKSAPELSKTGYSSEARMPSINISIGSRQSFGSMKLEDMIDEGKRVSFGQKDHEIYPSLSKSSTESGIRPSTPYPEVSPSAPDNWSLSTNQDDKPTLEKSEDKPSRFPRLLKHLSTLSLPRLSRLFPSKCDLPKGCQEEVNADQIVRSPGDVSE